MATKVKPYGGTTAGGVVLYRTGQSGRAARRKRFRFFIGGLIGGYSFASMSTQVVAAAPTLLAQIGATAGLAGGGMLLSALPGAASLDDPTNATESFSVGFGLGALTAGALQAAANLDSWRHTMPGAFPEVGASAGALGPGTPLRTGIELTTPAGAAVLDWLGFF